MTTREQKFCDEYLVCGNAAEAAVKAGYSPKTAAKASDWINEKSQEKPSSKFKAELRAYIDSELKRLHGERIADAEEVLRYLTSVMRGEMTEQVLRLVGDGIQQTAMLEISAKDRLKAAELIGKRYGMFSEKVDVSASADGCLADILKQLGEGGND